MLRRDYLGSAIVCLILFTLFGLGISNASHVNLGLYIKVLVGIILVALFIGLITYLSKKN
ncbi:MAG: hypothetical protein VYB18_02305 [Thermodesulfobacteriota bacterium]|jgi:hypothetical protein|nr:hypothetical protein [Thermodesulfobacteriota bacterium]